MGILGHSAKHRERMTSAKSDDFHTFEDLLGSSRYCNW